MLREKIGYIIVIIMSCTPMSGRAVDYSLFTPKAKPIPFHGVVPVEYQHWQHLGPGGGGGTCAARRARGAERA